MAISRADIEKRLQLGEDSFWEFKRIVFAGSTPKEPRRSDLADEIAAFANSRGGTLLCGVNDDGTLHGMSREQTVELDRLFVEISTNAIKPPIRIITSHWLLGDQRVLVVEIPEGDSQHDSSSGSYLPVGGTKQRMTSDERLRLAQRRGQARFRSSDQCVVPETGFGTLEETLWKPLLSKEGAFDPESALQKLGMLDKDDSHIVRATVAGSACMHAQARELDP